jgi:hypothetical protein
VAVGGKSWSAIPFTRRHVKHSCSVRALQPQCSGDRCCTVRARTSCAVRPGWDAQHAADAMARGACLTPLPITHPLAAHAGQTCTCTTRHFPKRDAEHKIEQLRRAQDTLHQVSRCGTPSSLAPCCISSWLRSLPMAVAASPAVRLQIGGVLCQAPLQQPAARRTTPHVDLHRQDVVRARAARDHQHHQLQCERDKGASLTARHQELSRTLQASQARATRRGGGGPHANA